MTIDHDELDTIAAPALGAQGERCARCGSPLASDQRYCLECGLRRADARLPFKDVLEARIRRETRADPLRVAAGAPPPAHRQVSPVYAGAGVAVLGLALALGILIGSAGDDQPRQVAAAPPQVITVATPAAGQPVAQEFTGDWPDGTDGYTVQLRTLPKDGTDVSAVQAAKSAAQGQGASDGRRARLRRLRESRRRQLRRLLGRLQVAQAGQEGAARAEGRLPGREGRAGVCERRRAGLRGRQGRPVRQEEGGHRRQGPAQGAQGPVAKGVPEEGQEAARHDQAARQGAAQGQQEARRWRARET